MQCSGAHGYSLDKGREYGEYGAKFEHQRVRKLLVCFSAHEHWTTSKKSTQDISPVILSS